MSKYTLKKSERLKKRDLIQRLFQEGKSMNKFPLKLLFLEADERLKHPALFGVTIPKKLFNKAVDRNKLKRRVRESYRIIKPELYKKLDALDKQFIFMFIYTSREKEEWKRIDSSVQYLLERFLKLYQSNAEF